MCVCVPVFGVCVCVCAWTQSDRFEDQVMLPRMQEIECRVVKLHVKPDCTPPVDACTSGVSTIVACGGSGEGALQALLVELCRKVRCER